MNAITPFNFEDQLFRVTEINGEPWFVAKDVCNILHIRNHRDAVGNLDEDEKGVGTADTLGGLQDVLIITESGLYALAFKSRKPEAKKFRKWITSEVLPSIRKTGKYQTEPDKPIEHYLPVDASVWLSAIREARLIRGNYVANALWAQSPLPPLPVKPKAPMPEPSELEQAFHDLRKASPIPGMTLKQIRAWILQRYDIGFDDVDLLELLRKFAVERRRLHVGGRNGKNRSVWVLTGKSITNKELAKTQLDWEPLR